MPVESHEQRTLIGRVRGLGLRPVLLLAEAFCLLLAAKISLRIFPVDKVLSWNASPARLLRAPSSAELLADCRLVRWAVMVVSDHSPISFVCFPQSLAARALLHHRGIQTQLYYGVSRKEGTLVTHTWLQVCDCNITGGEVAGDFSVLQIY